MTDKQIVGLIEDYVKNIEVGEIAHDFKHTDRVRNWAVKIATGEKYPDLKVVEIAALMHDIGLAKAQKRNEHGAVGADLAREFLEQNRLANEAQIAMIHEAIKLHNTIEKSANLLVGIIRDADILDLLGAVGIMRTFMAKHAMLDYLPENIRGLAWGQNSGYFSEKIQAGQRPAENIIDQLNFNISCAHNITTKIAREFAGSLVDYMKKFIAQLEREVISNK